MKRIVLINLNSVLTIALSVAFFLNCRHEFTNPIDPALLNSVPPKPGNIKIVESSFFHNAFSFDYNYHYAEGIIVFRNDVIIDTIHSVLIYYDSLLIEPNTQYSYKVCGYNQHGLSQFSDDIIITSPNAEVTGAIELTAILDGTINSGIKVILQPENPFNSTDTIELDSTGMRTTSYTYQAGTYFVTAIRPGFNNTYDTITVTAGIINYQDTLYLQDSTPPELHIDSITELSIFDTVKYHAVFFDSVSKQLEMAWDFTGTDTANLTFISVFSSFDTATTFSTAGKYNSKCYIRDERGNVTVATVPVKVVLDPPIAYAMYDTTVAESTFVYIHDNESFDKMGYIASYEWDFGGTGAFKVVSGGDTTIPVYNSSFICILRVTDDDGNSDLDTVKISIGLIGTLAGTVGNSGRSGHTSVIFKDKMWVIAGSENNDIWYSYNGATWICANSYAPFSKRIAHASVVYNNKIWVIQGRSANGIENDLWSSEDGINWKSSPVTPLFPERWGHSACVFKNKIWVIGGYTSQRNLNDIWVSEDALTWTEVTSHAPFAPRREHNTIVFDNKMWVIGGVGLNDIWYTEDGTLWVSANSAPEFLPRGNFGLVAYHNKLWILGGSNYEDIWRSNDGIYWENISNYAPFGNITYHTSIVFHNAIWVIGGSTNKVWCLK